MAIETIVLTSLAGIACPSTFPIIEANVNGVAIANGSYASSVREDSFPRKAEAPLTLHQLGLIQRTSRSLFQKLALAPTDDGLRQFMRPR